jgi:hypothetical protein
MIMRKVVIAAAMVALVPMARETNAQTTRVNVRVVSHDAKILGDGVGGARVVVRDPATGRVLSEGIQRGGTGDTGSIVREPHARGQTVYDTQGAGLFTAELDLDGPTVLEFVGEGPLGFEHALQRAVKRMLVVCGCPHTPGGLWDADRIRVSARIYDGPRMVREVALDYAGEPNMFTGSISLDGVRPGWHLVALANDPDRVNFGMSRPRKAGRRP